MGFDRDEFARRTKDGLKRLGETSDPPMTEHARYLADVKKEHTESPLTQDDRLMLEMGLREDWLAQLGVGTMRLTRSMLRLHCHGMTVIQDGRMLGFDERERLRAFRDSALFKRYAENLVNVMKKDDRKFFEVTSEIMSITDKKHDVFSVSDAGRRWLAESEAAYDYEQEHRRHAGIASVLYGGAHDSDGMFATYGLGFLAGGVLTGMMLGGAGGGQY